MDNVALDKLVRSLSFEVQAVPQDNIIQVTATSKSAPLNVKIRVRKKEEAGLHHGVLTLPPSTSHPHSSPEIIRLVSSDQTIMSFNMIMEADFGKPKKKTRKNILGIFKPACFRRQSDEDDQEGEIEDEGITQSDGALKRTSLKMNRDDRTRDFFGKCKPGGCLDPPFGEDREPYSPANEEEYACDDRVMMKAPTQSAENKSRSSSIYSSKIFSWKRKKSNDEVLDKNDGLKKEKGAKTESVVDLYQSGSLRTSDTYSNSVMTYPHTVNSSELRIQENKFPRSDIYIDQSKNSFNEHSGPFFVPGIIPGAPKKIRTEEEKIAEETIGSIRKPEEDQQPQGLGIDGTEKQPRSKDSGTDIRKPSKDPLPDISNKIDSDSAPKTDKENRMIPIPVIIPLPIPGANETPFTSVIKGEGETKEIEVLATSSNNNFDSGFEKTKPISEDKVDESNIEEPLDVQQNTNDNKQANVNNKQYPEDIKDDGIEHTLTPRRLNISQKNAPETKIAQDFESDLDFTDASATVGIPKEADSQSLTQNLDNVVQTDIVGSDDQSTKTTNKKDFTEHISLVENTEFGIYNNTEDKNPEIKKKIDDSLALENETAKKDDISNKTSNENESETPDKKSTDILGSDRQFSEYDLIDPDENSTTTGNNGSGIPTPIKRDTPLELEENDLQQIWQNDEDSLESVPLPLHTYKNMHDENIDILEKVNETINETLNANDVDALNDVTVDNHGENVSFSEKENKEEMEVYDSNGTEDASYPRKETEILEITQPDEANIDLEIMNVQEYGTKTIVGEDMNEASVHEKVSDAFIQNYDENLDRNSDLQQKSGDGTLTDQVRDRMKSDEKHIQFIDDIDTERNNEGVVVSSTEPDSLDDTKRIFENDSDVVTESKESYPDSYLSPTGRDLKSDIETTAERGKLDVTIPGFETKYPYHSISGTQTPETDIPKYFKLDLGIQSYIDNNKVIVKSFDSNTEPQRYPNDTIKVVKCDLEIGNEVLVPIGSENDLVVEIKSNKPKTRFIAVGRLDTGMTEKNNLGTESQISPVNRNLVIADGIRKTLLKMYEEELLPLRKSISELKSSMEVIASHQVVPKGRNMFEKRTRPSKIVPPLFKKCGCVRR